MMGVVIVVLVVIAALLAVVSGVWVALALITAISGQRAMPGLRQDFDEFSRGAHSSDTQCRTDGQSSE